MLDSDVRRGRPPTRWPWMPNPAVTESCSSGRISPKSSPFDRDKDCDGNPVVGDSCGSDLDAGPFVFRGLLIRFAKDWELRFVIRSSVESLGRGRGMLLDRDPYVWDGLLFGVSRIDVAIEDVPVAVVVVVVVVGLLDRAEKEAARAPTLGDGREKAEVEAVEDSLEVEGLGCLRWLGRLLWDVPDRLNFLVRSLTLGG